MNMKKKRNLIGFLMVFMLIALMSVFGMPMMAKAAPAAHSGHAAHFLGDSSHIGWTEIKNQNDLIKLGETGGCGYLTSDIVLTSGSICVYEDKRVYLCLNGYSISVVTGNGAFLIDTNAKFILYDEVGNTGKIIGLEDARVSAVWVAGGDFTMKGGTITGNHAVEGGGVKVSDNGVFTMDGGKITENSVEWAGGGVAVMSDTSTFTLNGGEISENTACGDVGIGGGVFIGNGAFIMNGGTITGNHSIEGGGGVYLTDGTITMNAGEISENVTNSYGGGGVYTQGALS